MLLWGLLAQLTPRNTIITYVPNRFWLIHTCFCAYPIPKPPRSPARAEGDSEEASDDFWGRKLRKSLENLTKPDISGFRPPWCQEAETRPCPMKGIHVTYLHQTKTYGGLPGLRPHKSSIRKGWSSAGNVTQWFMSAPKSGFMGAEALKPPEFLV